MKLLRMHVDDFGCLHEFDYEFGEGLNILLRDNGWGKTTAAAFLKAMLYGYDNRRSKDITENERRRYLPWQGGKYGGSLDFEAEGVSYRILRRFGEAPRFDTVRILNLDTGTTARINPEKIGETLFGLDVNAFQRSVFINQNGLSIQGAAGSIHTRLNSLVSQANDIAAYDGAIADLTQRIKVYEKTGMRGELGDIVREIAVKERERDRLEKEISEQDAARERVAGINTQLSAVNAGLEEKKARVDVLSGENKKREASEKLLGELNAKIHTLQEKLDALRAGLGGEIPGSEEIDNAKKWEDAVRTAGESLKELTDRYDGTAREYRSLLDKYHGRLPDEAQLNELQRLYSELQGLNAGAEQTAEAEEAPEEYRLIESAEEKEPGYPAVLEELTGRQTELEELVRTAENASDALEREEKSWAEKKKRFLARKSELSRSRAALDAASAGQPDRIRPALERLSELQGLRRLAELQEGEYAAARLSAEEEKLLAEAPQELPDETDCRKMLENLRSAVKKEAELQGLQARKTGEESKETGLQAALSQYDAIPAFEVMQDAPKKPASGVMIGCGAAAFILGVILGIAVGPALFALAVIGAVLVVFGVVTDRQYASRLRKYEAEQAAEEKRRAAEAKRTELEAQLREERKTLSDLREEIRRTASEAEMSREAAAAWLTRFAPDAELSERSVQAVMERAERVVRLRQKAEKAEEAGRCLQETQKRLTAGEEELKIGFPELRGRDPEAQAETLRSMETAYQVRLSENQRAEQEYAALLTAEQLSEEQLSGEESPAMPLIREAGETAEQTLAEQMREADRILGLIGMSLSCEHAGIVLRKAEQVLSVYRSFLARKNENEERRQAHRRKQEALQTRLAAAAGALSGRAEDRPLPERIALARQDIMEANRKRDKLSEIEAEQERLTDREHDAKQALAAFLRKYASASTGGNSLEEIRAQTAEYTSASAALGQLESQRDSILADTQTQAASEEERSLRLEIAEDEKRRDELIVEYTQKTDFIRRADQALEVYPDVVQEIRRLNEQKQKAQNELLTLKRAIRLITQAKENLANRYLGRVEELFNRYMQVWLQSEAVRGILDTDFHITIEENGKVHLAEGYSSGTGDLIDFCMRLALVDTLFEKEQPFLILDDPFVNLDEEHLEKALELLSVMGLNRQIIYFVCHPIRAAEAEGGSASREEFRRLSAAARQNAEQRSGPAVRAAAPRKTPKELYHIAAGTGPLAIRPARPGYTITNSIFSMGFVLSGEDMSPDRSYELFFIDKPGRVLNDRQLLEVRNGKLSTERIQFSLNTRDDSGDEYELMIRESGQDDYEVVARIPFKAKLAFAGTFSFD